MIFLAYMGCSTCRKAKKWLDEHHIEYEQRDIKADKPNVDELKSWHVLSEQPLKKLFNTSGMLYKNWSIKEKLPKMSEEEQYQLLAKDGMLVKRPLIITDDYILIGFKEKEWEEKLLGGKME